MPVPASCDILSLRPQAADWRTVGGEVIAIERATSTYVTANEAGSALWAALAAGATLHELVELIAVSSRLLSLQGRAVNACEVR